MINSKKQINYKIIVISFIMAYLAGVVPLPVKVALFRPEWVVLVLIYWCMVHPSDVSVGTGWFVGLLQDSLRGGLLGQHALTYALVAYLTVQLHQRLKLFPLWQQSFTAMLLVGCAQLIAMWIHGMTGTPANTVQYIAPALTSLLVWPFIYYILSEVSIRQMKVA